MILYLSITANIAKRKYNAIKRSIYVRVLNILHHRVSCRFLLEIVTLCSPVVNL